MSLEVARVLVEVGFASSLGERNGRGSAGLRILFVRGVSLDLSTKLSNRGAEVKYRNENESLVSCVGMICTP
jgi:hypothetical protein